jgi:hypothetical protein
MYTMRLMLYAGRAEDAASDFHRSDSESRYLRGALSSSRAPSSSCSGEMSGRYIRAGRDASDVRHPPATAEADWRPKGGGQGCAEDVQSLPFSSDVSSRIRPEHACIASENSWSAMARRSVSIPSGRDRHFISRSGHVPHGRHYDRHDEAL